MHKHLEDQNQNQRRFYAQSLALGGAPAERILDVWSSSSSSSSAASASDPRDDQDAFALMILDECERCGSSIRYLKHIARLYVRRIEERQPQQHEENLSSSNAKSCKIESDLLSEWILRTSLQRETAPSEDDSCILSFALPPSQPTQLDARRKQKRQAEEQPEDRTDQKEFEVQQQRHLLRIRVFPYHNDVALRLWEAGGFLAEYFVKHPDLVSSKHVIELGAGVGLTGLVLAAICNPASIYLTDYTDVSRRNLQHNLDLNRELLRRQYQFDPSLISQGYLEWNDFSLKLLQSDDSAAAEQRNVSSKIELDVHEDDMGETLAAFQRAEVLIAADVIYDTTVIDSLVCVVRNFLSPSSCDDTQQKVAIFAITRRIIDSFHLFLDRVKAHGIRCTWLASGDDYADFPRIIESTFTQPRKDVQIAQLAIRSGE